MNISVLSVFPALYTSFFDTSLMRRAQESRLISVAVDSFFSYVDPKERIDAPTFGHGSGMVLRPDVVEKAIEARQGVSGPAFKIFFSPHGKKLTQHMLAELVKRIQAVNHVMLVAARYEGMDVRVEQEYADEIISIGDYVLMGGDLPAMVLLEGLTRLIPGVVGKAESVIHDSFQGPFVDYPEYCAPVVWHSREVPEIVRSGNHGAIAEWRLQQAAERTVSSHFDWLRASPLSTEVKKRVQSIIPPHYVVLMHGEVLVGPERQPGATSVTSIDIHDIARSCATYGVKQFFIVTPLVDQQRIVMTLLDFWQKGAGIEYNVVRHQAVKQVQVVATIDEVIGRIAAAEGGIDPLLVGTSARLTPHADSIAYCDQETAWRSKKPLLFVFGTGQGLTDALMARCHYILPPVTGFASFNHLSVRSAVAIILDRWLGINQKSG